MAEWRNSTGRNIVPVHRSGDARLASRKYTNIRGGKEAAPTKREDSMSLHQLPQASYGGF